MQSQETSYVTYAEWWQLEIVIAFECPDLQFLQKINMKCTKVLTSLEKPFINKIGWAVGWSRACEWCDKLDA